jgi:hypothetical protein
MRSRDPSAPKKTRRAQPPEEIVMHATTQLPGQYAVVRNVLEEMRRRLGSGWLAEAQAEAIAIREDIVAKSKYGSKVQQEPETEEVDKSLEAEVDKVDTSVTSSEHDDVKAAAESQDRDKPKAPPADAISIVEFSNTLGAGFW